MVTPEIAAIKIVNGMEKDKFQVFIVKDANMMNLIYRLNPRWATDFMSRRIRLLLP
jgi:hypothetical protein